MGLWRFSPMNMVFRDEMVRMEKSRGEEGVPGRGMECCVLHLCLKGGLRRFDGFDKENGL